MTEENTKFVDFEKYCAACKHRELDEYKDPCNQCLEIGARVGTDKPDNYISKEDTK